MAKKIMIVENKKRKLLVVLVTFILLILLIITNILYNIELRKMRDKIKIKNNIISDLEEEYYNLTKQNLDEEVKNSKNEKKLKFYDENIVFKIEGYGNYYYTYDCMMKKVNGEFRYWAYNKDAAKIQGLLEGSC